jgi:hypothetical protein
MAVLLKTVSLFRYGIVSSAVNVLDRIPMEYTCPPLQVVSGRGGFIFFLTVVYAKLGGLFLLYVVIVQSVL